MIDKISVTKCIQCKNCKNICPMHAITMEKIEGTFIYPKVDNGKCIKCQKCETVCPVLNPLEKNELISSYAVKHKNKEIRLQSSSGGLFTALAEVIINRKGYVFGAAFQDGFKVAHIGINSNNEILLLRGSKYVQSDLKDTFVRILKLLKNENTVLFSGTPCQCAALKVYLQNKKYKGNLYVVDFICHGILSENLFAEYIQYLEKRGKSKIKAFEFRDKTYGWLESGIKINYYNGKVKRWPLYEDLYMQGYFQALCMRESCYSCAYKNFHSGSDITMGDFWGADVLAQNFFDQYGTSLCCVQTEKGEELILQARKYLDIQKMPLEILTKYNQGLIYPFEKGDKSERYFEEARRKGNIVALKNITKLTQSEKIKRIFRKIKRELNKKDQL